MIQEDALGAFYRAYKATSHRFRETIAISALVQKGRTSQELVGLIRFNTATSMELLDAALARLSLLWGIGRWFQVLVFIWPLTRIMKSLVEEP